jgi:hypothetical protein
MLSWSVRVILMRELGNSSPPQRMPTRRPRQRRCVGVSTLVPTHSQGLAAGRLLQGTGQFQLSSSAAKNPQDRFGVRRQWRQEATSQLTSRLPSPREARSSAFSSCPDGWPMASDTWPISAPTLAVAFFPSNRSEANRSGSINPSTPSSVLSGTISDIRAKSRSFWPATRHCGASRPCCPPKGIRLDRRGAQCPSGPPRAALIAPVRTAVTTSRTDALQIRNISSGRRDHFRSAGPGISHEPHYWRRSSQPPGWCCPVRRGRITATQSREAGTDTVCSACGPRPRSGLVVLLWWCSEPAGCLSAGNTVRASVDPLMIVANGQHEVGLNPLIIHGNTTG